MQLAARIGAWNGKALPYLRRVAYLESHGTEWIDLGIPMRPNMTYGFEIGSKSYVEDYTFLGNFTSLQRFLLGYMFKGSFAISFGSVSTQTNVLYIRDFTDSLFKYSLSLTDDTATVVIGGETKHYNPSDIPTIVDTLHIGCRTVSGGPSAMRNGMYGAISAEGGGYKSSFIPVLDLSGRPAMYDEVSGQSFYNQGTGEFTWGELDAASNAPSQLGGGV